MMQSYRFEGDGWTADGPKITSAENLDAIRKAMDGSGPVIVEHRIYRGSRSPERRVFEDFDDFKHWLETTAAGDAIWVWDFGALCTDEAAIAHGKQPDEQGRVPTRGAY